LALGLCTAGVNRRRRAKTKGLKPKTKM